MPTPNPWSPDEDQPPGPKAIGLLQPQRSPAGTLAMPTVPAIMGGSPQQMAQAQFIQANMPGVLNAVPNQPGKIAKLSAGNTKTQADKSATTQKDEEDSKTHSLVTDSLYNPEKVASDEAAKRAAALMGFPEVGDEQRDLADRSELLRKTLPMMIKGDSGYATLAKAFQQAADKSGKTDYAKDMASSPTAASLGEEGMKQLSSLANQRGAIVNQIREAMGQVKPSTVTNVQDLTKKTLLDQADTSTTTDTAKTDATAGVQPLRSTGNPASNLFRVNAVSDKDLLPYRQIGDAAQKALTTFKNNTSVSDQAAALEFIKPLVSRLTNFEYSKLGKGGSDLGSRAGQAVETLFTGEFTPKNKAQYIGALNTLVEANNAQAAYLQAGHAKLGKAAGLSPNEIDAATGTHFQPGKTSPTAPVEAGMTPEEIQGAKAFIANNPKDARAKDMQKVLDKMGVK